MPNLLEALPEYVLYWLVKKGKERTLQEKEVLFSQGEPNDSLYIVLDGLFGVYATATVATHTEHVGPGSLLGETSFFTDGLEPATVIAEESSLVLELPKKDLKEKLEYDHRYAADFYKALLQTVSHRLKQTSLKLYAAEGAAETDFTRDPIVRKAQEEIDRFKKTMVDLDKEAMKKGSISEQSLQGFLAQARDLERTCHDVLGPSSPIADHIKERIGARLQHEMLPYVLTTETAERFYSKPRGYAGDYLAIHQIYRNQPGGTGRLGPVIDRMFLERPPSVAVRNRRRLMAEEIARTARVSTNGPASVACLASGPASEVFDAFSTLEDKSRLKVTLMDIDLQALAFVDERRGKEKLVSQISLINENLIALFLGRAKTRIEPQDMIYSIGLIDYLNDKLVNKLLHYVYESLKPGGRVILGNFHPSNTAKEFMDYVLEWNLIHRTEDDMNRLFQNSPFKRPCTKIQFEAEGVDLFAECVKDQVDAK